MSEQVPPPMRPPVIIDDPTFNERVKKLVEAGGNLTRSGLTLEEVADMIHTRRMTINPLGEATEEPKPKKKATKVTGTDKLDDFLE